jgi:putative flippase GtrA
MRAVRTLIRQLASFGVVGLGGLVVDVGVFNLLRLTVLAPEALHEGPFIAKVISTSLAIVVNWLGNRYWTFRHHRRAQLVREGFEFVLVSLGGMLIALACLWVSHYLLGYTSAVADNISTNVVGLALGTAFRFTFYRLWVFNPDRPGVRPASLRPAEARVAPSGRAPLAGVQYVAPVEDRTLPHD